MSKDYNDGYWDGLSGVHQNMDEGIFSDYTSGYMDGQSAFYDSSSYPEDMLDEDDYINDPTDEYDDFDRDLYDDFDRDLYDDLYRDSYNDFDRDLYDDYDEFHPVPDKVPNATPQTASAATEDPTVAGTVQPIEPQTNKEHSTHKYLTVSGIVATSIFAIAISAVIIYTMEQRSMQNKAIAYINEGKYEEAVEILEDTDVWCTSSQLLLDYADARIAFRDGNYSKGYLILDHISTSYSGPFSDIAASLDKLYKKEISATKEYPFYYMCDKYANNRYDISDYYDSGKSMLIPAD